MKKTWTTVLFTSIFFLIPFFSLGQEKQKDVIYLINGSIIKGMIIELIPNQTVKIKTADGSLFVFKMEEVEKILKEENPSQTTKTQNKSTEVAETRLILVPQLPSPFPKRKTKQAVGYLIFSTDIPGQLFLDEKQIKKVGIYDIVKARGIPPNSYVLKFYHSSDSTVQRIDIDSNKIYNFRFSNNSFINQNISISNHRLTSRFRVGMKYIPKLKGAYFACDVGVLIGLGISGEISFRSGYYFSPNLMLGGGIKYLPIPYDDWIVPKGSTNTFLPIFLDFQVNLLRQLVTPIIGVKIGYSPFITSSIEVQDYEYSYKGGIYFGLNLGVRTYIKNQHSIELIIGFNGVNTHEDIKNLNTILSSKRTNLMALSIAVGYSL